MSIIIPSNVTVPGAIKGALVDTGFSKISVSDGTSLYPVMTGPSNAVYFATAVNAPNVTLTNATYGNIVGNIFYWVKTLGAVGTLVVWNFKTTSQPGIATIGPTTWTSTTNPFATVPTTGQTLYYPCMFNSSTLGISVAYITITTTGGMTMNINYAGGAGTPTFLTACGSFD